MKYFADFGPGKSEEEERVFRSAGAQIRSHSRREKLLDEKMWGTRQSKQGITNPAVRTEVSDNRFRWCCRLSLCPWPTQTYHGNSKFWDWCGLRQSNFDSLFLLISYLLKLRFSPKKQQHWIPFSMIQLSKCLKFDQVNHVHIVALSINFKMPF